MSITEEEYDELLAIFSYITNYSSDDPMDPINPITYIAPDGDSCLHVASIIGNKRAVELLLKGGVGVNDQGDLGYTALHIAKKKGYNCIVKILIKHGASSIILDNFGRAP